MSEVETMFEMIFEFVMLIITMFPLFLFVFFFYVIAKASKSSGSNTSKTMNNGNTRDYGGIIRAGGRHYHKGSVGSTRKDEEWEETRCKTYKEEAFGKDICNNYIKPDYDSLTCEDEDLSGG